MDERSFRSNWADDLHKTFFARMQSPHEDFWHTVTIYIDEPHQILGTHMPQGSEYSFNARLDGIERESWWLTPRGSTRPFVPGMSVNFTARGSAYREQTGWVREGSVMVSRGPTTDIWVSGSIWRF